MLKLSGDVLPATFAALRRCGGGARECVVYWAGPVNTPGVVDRIIQPPHTASARHYEIDQSWVTDLFLELRATACSVRAQVHTHPAGHVRHSPTDDAFALAPSVGFISLVLPHFGMGRVALDGSYAAVVTSTGWCDADPGQVITWS